MATTMIQNISCEEERFAYDPMVGEANVIANEDYEDWVHEQNMDAEFDMVDYHTNKNRKMAQNVRDKKLTKSKQDETQKELLKQKLKEMEVAKQLKIQKTKDRKADEKLRILERKDRQDVKDIGLDENQHGTGEQIETEALVKENWDDGLDW